MFLSLALCDAYEVRQQHQAPNTASENIEYGTTADYTREKTLASLFVVFHN